MKKLSNSMGVVIKNKLRVKLILNQHQDFSSSDSPINEKLLNNVHRLIIDNLKRVRKSEKKGVDFKTPEELLGLIDFEIRDSGEKENSSDADENILNICKKVIDYSVHPTHPHYFNTLFGGFDEYSYAGEMISSGLNGTMYSYEMAPVFTLMENSIYKKYSEIIGWDASLTEGIFCPGGSIANLYGLLLARHFRFPNVKEDGMKNLPEIVLFTSELGHYSIEKSAIVLGIGKKNVIKVPTDLNGKIIPSELDKYIIKAKNEGKYPLAVNATIGTTVYGAIDPISEISKICRKHDIWFHIDACYGGPIVFLDEYKHLYNGIEDADSIVFDPHKVLTVPMQCSLFMTKHKGLLKQCNSTNADYLFMKDKIAYDAELDSGDGSIQCGRKIDIVKFWLYLKAKGFEKLENDIRTAINNAKYLAELIKIHPNYQLILEPEYLSVCFNYFPDKYVAQINNGRKKDNSFWEKIEKIPPIIKANMIKEGTMMIAYQKQQQETKILKNFFRPIITIDKTTKDMDFMIEEIHRLGKNL